MVHFVSNHLLAPSASACGPPSPVNHGLRPQAPLLTTSFLSPGRIEPSWPLMVLSVIPGHPARSGHVARARACAQGGQVGVWVGGGGGVAGRGWLWTGAVAGQAWPGCRRPCLQDSLHSTDLFLQVDRWEKQRPPPHEVMQLGRLHVPLVPLITAPVVRPALESALAAK